ncbi:MAG TPA: hypothetical protein VN213_13520 [Solirubrobacteraceae bacterium]|nr:hypothetical protein [Solirubrobacteraceae bacterium]
MILPAALARKVLRGEKTEHRIPLRINREFNCPHPCPYDVGEVHSLRSAQGEPELGWVRVAARARQTLNTITAADARAEGHPTLHAFAEHWLCRYDRGWPPAETVPCDVCDADQAIVPNPDHDPSDPDSEEWVACPHCDMGALTRPARVTALVALDAVAAPYGRRLCWTVTPAQALERFQARHGHKQAWVLTLTPLTQRFLDAKPGRAGDSEQDRGYTINPARAVRSEHEAVDDQELARQRARADQRRLKHHRSVQRDRELLAAEDRLRALYDNPVAYRNAADEIKLVRKMLQHGRSDSAVLMELRRAERKAHREAA